MNELVSVVKNNVVVSSLQVAEHFNKRHDKLFSEIERMYGDLTDTSGRMSKMVETPFFYLHKYRHPQNGQFYQEWLMNRDGFALLVMGFTGKKALAWKLKYIDAFNRMEKLLTEKQTAVWVETRKAGILTRRCETDVIKELIGYAKAQGSTHADILYVTYSKLANKIAGVSKRDLASVKQLNILDELESMIYHVIKLGMAAGKHYKEIYQDCKRRLEWWQDCTFRLGA
jgi:Rha family phage regulatory protein